MQLLIQNRRTVNTICDNVHYSVCVARRANVIAPIFVSLPLSTRAFNRAPHKRLYKSIRPIGRAQSASCVRCACVYLCVDFAIGARALSFQMSVVHTCTRNLEHKRAHVWRRRLQRCARKDAYDKQQHCGRHTTTASKAAAVDRPAQICNVTNLFR